MSPFEEQSNRPYRSLLAVLIYAAPPWARGNWSLLGRLHYSLAALSTLTFVSPLAYYNLIGYKS
jgi:hypothetical protein